MIEGRWSRLVVLALRVHAARTTATLHTTVSVGGRPLQVKALSTGREVLQIRKSVQTTSCLWLLCPGNFLLKKLHYVLTKLWLQPGTHWPQLVGYRSALEEADMLQACDVCCL